jgi:hypothetical protein
MNWIEASKRLPKIDIVDRRDPVHFVFVNTLNHTSIVIYTEFITQFPPIITKHLSDWKWLDESNEHEVHIKIEEGSGELFNDTCKQMSIECSQLQTKPRPHRPTEHIVTIENPIDLFYLGLTFQNNLINQNESH